MNSHINIFEGDALNRSSFANNLDRLISGLSSGVIAIDGAWGAGKTWFGERVCTTLQQRPSVKTVWLDTFSADWSDDPLLSLLAEFAEQMPENSRQKFISAAAPLAGNLLVAVGKAGLQAAGNLIGLDAETVDGVANAAHSSGDAYIKKQLQELVDRKKSIGGLKKLLQNAAAQNGKVVVFVDELDRCSPAYAIRFLERIKHLFDVPGVVFVLIWNRAQIQQSVKTFYGQETDGQMYLDRFVDYPFRLPNHHQTGRVAGMGLIVEEEIKCVQGIAQRALAEASHHIGAHADLLGLTARETRHVCAWWVMSPNKHYAVLEVWLLCLKVKRPDIYAGLAVEGVEEHKAAQRLLADPPKHLQFEHFFAALLKFHRACASKDVSQAPEFSPALFGPNQPDLLNLTSRCIARHESIAP